MIRIKDNFFDKIQLEETEKIINKTKAVDGKKTAGGTFSKQFKQNKQHYDKQLFDVFLINQGSQKWIRDHVSPISHQLVHIMASYYNKNDFYDFHSDISWFVSRTKKIAFTIFLNDKTDYDGGELEIITEDGPIIIKGNKGSGVFYPSRYIHKVHKIKKGKRKVLVGWMDCAIANQLDRYEVIENLKKLKQLQKIIENLPKDNKKLKKELSTIAVYFAHFSNEFTRKCISLQLPKGIKYIGKRISKTCGCCGEYYYNCRFFSWTSLVTDEFLCEICYKCAKRELFGEHKKNKKRFEEWVSEFQEK